MIRVSKRSITRLLVAWIILAGLICPHRAIASNRAMDIKTVEKPDQTILLLNLDERPRFALKSLDENGIILTLFDTLPAQDLPEKVPDQGPVEIDKGSDNLGFKIKFKRPVYRIDSSWLEDKKLLYIKALPGEDDDEPETPAQAPPNLKGVRFGFKEKATRMVMSLDRRPAWEISYQEPTAITMRLDAESRDLKEKKYGPLKLLKEVSVLRSDLDKMDISLKLESQMDHVRIFWMKVGNRLVMDLFSEPLEIDDEVASVPPKPEKQGEDIKISEDSSNDGSEEEPLVANIVRMKIPQKERDASGDKKEEDAPAVAVNDKDLKIEPKLDNLFPFSPESKVSVQDLGPEEAFLFGRIQEAREINDNNKGLILANYFLKQFPKSVLAENISFWRGDFNYNLFRTGDDNAATDTVLSYQYAIDRFGWSGFTPMAYIKMAQVSSMTGDDYSAIGFLGLVIGRGEKGDYLPMAYLMRGKIYLQMGQAEKAIEDFKVLLETYPDSPLRTEAQFWVADYFHMIGQYEEADKRLMEIAKTNPDLFLEYPEYLFITARNYLYLNKFDLARDYLFKALNLGHQPESIDMLLSRIGDTYHNQNNEKEAEKYYRMVVDYYPKSEGASIAKLRLADYFSDIAILENLSQEKNNEPIGDLAMLEKAYQLFEKEQYLAVQDNLKDLMEKPVQTETRKEAKQLFYRASEKEMVRLYKEAKPNELIALYNAKKELLQDNIDPEVLLLVAQAYNDLSMYDDSVLTFNQIRPYDLKRKSKGGYFYGLAKGYMGNSDMKSARSLLENSENQELEPLDRKRLDMLLADIYMEEGELEDANLLYRSIVKGKRGFPDKEIARAYLSMGIISNIQKNYQESKRALNRCIALAGKTDQSDDLLQSAHMELGKVLQNEGNPREAVKFFERGFELGYGPDKGEYWGNRFRLALSYMDIGQGPKAEPLLNEISEEGDPVLQQKAQIRLGSIGLESQLQRLSIRGIGGK